MKRVTLAPSQFAFAYRQCRRCVWLRVHGLRTEETKLPPIFGYVAGAMRSGITAEDLRQLGVPVVSLMERTRILSEPQEFDGISITLSGYVDRVAELDDGTFGIVDYKLVKLDELKLRDYRAQLHAYELALRRPATGEPLEVTSLGLVVFDPSQSGFRIYRGDDGEVRGAAYKAPVGYLPIEMDRSWFDSLLQEFADLLVRPQMPESGEFCSRCQDLAQLAEYHRNHARAVPA